MTFSNETIIAICSLIGTILSILGIFFSLLAKTKNKKARNIAERMLKVIDFSKDAVKMAEQFTNFTGKEKKEYAMTLVKQCCIECGIPINDEEISNNIEDVISISKSINFREQNKEQ